MAEERFFEGPLYGARHDLWEAQMERFGGDIPWLHEGIPPEAVGDPYADAMDHLGTWMIDQLVEWSNRTAPQLPAETVRRIFDDYQLASPERVAVRGLVFERARAAFAPGIETMVVVHKPVPWVAARAGEVHDQDAWTARSWQARLFAAGFAGSGTNVLGLVRRYLTYGQFSPYQILDPAKLKPDEHTGITTVTPLSEIVAAAASAVDTVAGAQLERTACVAREAQPIGLSSNFYDALWDAYTTAVGRYIYPVRPPATTPFPQAEPDPHIRETMLQLAHTHHILR